MEWRVLRALRRVLVNSAERMFGALGWVTRRLFNFGTLCASRILWGTPVQLPYTILVHVLQYWIRRRQRRQEQQKRLQREHAADVEDDAIESGRRGSVRSIRAQASSSEQDAVPNSELSTASAARRSVQDAETQTPSPVSTAERQRLRSLMEEAAEEDEDDEFLPKVYQHPPPPPPPPAAGGGGGTGGRICYSEYFGGAPNKLNRGSRSNDRSQNDDDCQGNDSQRDDGAQNNNTSRHNNSAQSNTVEITNTGSRPNARPQSSRPRIPPARTLGYGGNRGYGAYPEPGSSDGVNRGGRMRSIAPEPIAPTGEYPDPLFPLDMTADDSAEHAAELESDPALRRDLESMPRPPSRQDKTSEQSTDTPAGGTDGISPGEGLPFAGHSAGNSPFYLGLPPGLRRPSPPLTRPPSPERSRDEDESPPVSPLTTRANGEFDRQSSGPRIKFVEPAGRGGHRSSSGSSTHQRKRSGPTVDEVEADENLSPEERRTSSAIAKSLSGDRSKTASGKTTPSRATKYAGPATLGSSKPLLPKPDENTALLRKPSRQRTGPSTSGNTSSCAGSTSNGAGHSRDRNMCLTILCHNCPCDPEQQSDLQASNDDGFQPVRVAASIINRVAEALGCALDLMAEEYAPPPSPVVPGQEPSNAAATSSVPRRRVSAEGYHEIDESDESDLARLTQLSSPPQVTLHSVQKSPRKPSSSSVPFLVPDAIEVSSNSSNLISEKISFSMVIL